MENRAEKLNPTTETYEVTIAKQNAQIAELSAKLKWYEEQFRLAQQKRFGASSEKTHPDQLDLFNEAEAEADPAKEEPLLETVTYKRKKQRGGRDAKLDGLRVETVEYLLPAEEQVCACCDGALHEMSTEIRRELKVIPAEVKVVEHIRHVYGCRQCEPEAIASISGRNLRRIYAMADWKSTAIEASDPLSHSLLAVRIGCSPIHRAVQRRAPSSTASLKQQKRTA